MFELTTSANFKSRCYNENIGEEPCDNTTLLHSPLKTVAWFIAKITVNLQSLDGYFFGLNFRISMTNMVTEIANISALKTDMLSFLKVTLNQHRHHPISER
ncbi:hypothetical protein EFR36_04990 [Latilactobacillus curvatus]|nr:hypothetical protein [Latilactobacillus curvatus]QAS50584.1 hypothetical protein LCU_09610 [Latilactobacillus curvatus JCM 1096 = DSM 20019]